MESQVTSKVIQFGYSEGGLIAEYVYGASNYKIDTIMVDSPGSLEALQKKYNDNQNLFESKKGSFEYYCRLPNVFNSSLHVIPKEAKLYLIKTPYTVFGIGKKDYWNFSVENHSFQNIKKAIEDPNNIKEIKSYWPQTLEAGFGFYTNSEYNRDYLMTMVKKEMFPRVCSKLGLNKSSENEFNKLYKFFTQNYLNKNGDSSSEMDFNKVSDEYCKLSQNAYNNPSKSKIIEYAWLCCCCCVALPMKLFSSEKPTSSEKENYFTFFLSNNQILPEVKILGDSNLDHED